MGNKSLLLNNGHPQDYNFDKIHPNFDKLFSKYQNDNYIDKIKFNQLFCPLTSDSIPLDDLFKIYANAQGKISKLKIKKLYCLFFGQNETYSSQQIKLLILSKNATNQIDKNKIESLFNHTIDLEIKNCLLNYLQYKPQSNITYTPNQSIFPLAKEEITNFKIYSQRTNCLIVKCDCNKKKDILPSKEGIGLGALTYKEFKKIEKENNSKFPIKILQSLFEKYNYSDPELSEIITKYLKRYTLSDYIDFTRFSSFFNLLITKSQGTYEDILEVLKIISFYKAPKNDIIKNKHLLINRQKSINKTNITSRKNLADIDLDECISNKTSTELISLSSIPAIKFNYSFFEPRIICNYIRNIFQIFNIQEYQQAIFKRNDLFYFTDKNTFEQILDVIKSNDLSKLKECFITFKNLLEGEMPRLKKEITIHQIILLDEMLFTYLKVLIPTEPGELGQYAKLQKIKYELNTKDKLPEHTMFETDGNIIYELELYPICVIAYSFKEEYKSQKGLKNIKEIVSSINITAYNTESFSRKSKIKDVIETFDKNGWFKSSSLIKPITYYMFTNDEKFFQIENMEQTLEELKSDKIFLLFDSINPDCVSNLKSIQEYEITYYQSL